MKKKELLEKLKKLQEKCISLEVEKAALKQANDDLVVEFQKYREKAEEKNLKRYNEQKEKVIKWLYGEYEK